MIGISNCQLDCCGTWQKVLYFLYFQWASGEFFKYEEALSRQRSICQLKRHLAWTQV